MGEPSFQYQASVWGQAFEIAVKRGVLACLLHKNLLLDAHPVVQEWRKVRLGTLYHAIITSLGVVDEEVIRQNGSAAEHQAIMGYGLGYTAMREYLTRLAKQLELGTLTLRGLWCPLVLPGPRDVDTERREARERFAAEFGLREPVDPALSDKGMPANSDFTLWLSGKHAEDHLLVIEFSYDIASFGDFRDEEAHLDELLRHRRLVDSRGVFSRVAAEVEEEHFELSDDIKTHLSALTTDDKPFYKLCQGSAYAESTVKLLAKHGRIEKPCVVRALAVTPNGIESSAAKFSLTGLLDPRLALMEQLGAAYRSAKKFRDGDEESLTQEVEGVFNGLLRRLPRALYQGLKELRHMPLPGEDIRLEFEEKIPDFNNPMQAFSRNEALAMVDESDTLREYFGESPREALGRALRPGEVTLRDLHAAAVIAGLIAAKPGRINAIALEGNPGIGKTTAVQRHLAARESGYLFLYVSPRVVINRDVTEKLARKDGEPSGILTVTTNAQIISAAERWHLEQVKQGLAKRRHIDGAVVADGVPDLTAPDGSVLVLTPEQEHEIDAAHAGSRLAKTTLSENEDIVVERSLLGVLSAMAQTTRELLRLNPAVNRAVLTAALQGFREKENRKTTIEALSQLFKSRADSNAGLAERRAFAERMPYVVVMVDELAGDGAGAPFVHAVAQWLKKEFIDPFDGESPFTVVLLVSDASLGNEVVISRYLNVGDWAPDKVLVSKSNGERCFRLAATKIRLGAGMRDTLHVMTNSFPASELSVQYRVNLTAVELTETPEGLMKSPRKAVREAAEAALLDNAMSEILRALNAGAEQVIYFAQDKQFLGELRRQLSAEKDYGLDSKNVQVLDSSVPGWRRKQLVEEETRDSIRVFLMTSSGARGVSFPKTDWIIAAVPRFFVEASLMELAQLIYRGRGMHRDPISGKEVSRDNVPRRLVMLVEDFLVHEDALDRRQWLRQAIDLLTLLVMLRSTILTRIKGDAGLTQHALALVPVGGVGLEELMSLMSQYVSAFIREADIYLKRAGSNELQGLVQNTRANIVELFARFRLQGTAKKGMKGFSFVRAKDASEFVQQVSLPVLALLPPADEAPVLPEHIYCTGPMFLERWQDFDKREVFSFEGWETEADKMTRHLYGQLRRIDEERELPSTLRIPALNLYRLLAREKPGAANEFSTLKELKSPNTWVGVPVAYTQFMTSVGAHDERIKVLAEPEQWREGLGRTLSGNSNVMPPIPRYDGLPWVAAVYQGNPLKLEVVFDDRYFMASSELNLLNTLLLSRQGS